MKTVQPNEISVSTPCEITPDGYFLLRTPFLPAKAFGLKRDPLSASKEITDALPLSEAEWQGEITETRATLMEMLKDPEILRAIYIASPDLHRSLPYWMSEPESKKGVQIERSLLRYLSRMSNRSTPFGLFAGTSLGMVAKKASEQSNLGLDIRDSYRSSTRLDFECLASIGRSLAEKYLAQDDHRYIANTSLHRTGDSWRYIETAINDEALSYQLSEVENSASLALMIDCCRYTPLSFRDLSSKLRGTGGTNFSREEAHNFLQELVNNDILRSMLAPAVTGCDPIWEMVAELSRIEVASNEVMTLKFIANQLRILDEDHCAPIKYEELKQKISLLLPKAYKKDIFQTDLVKPLSGPLIGKNVIDEISKTLHALSKIGGSRNRPELEYFKEVFVDRYERAWIPLLQALDPDRGVNLDNSSLRTSHRQAPRPDAANLVDSLSKFQAHLLKSMTSVGRAPFGEVVLTHEDIESLALHPVRFPSSFECHFSIAATSMESVNNGDFIIHHRGFQGPSSARTAGRFCSAMPDLASCVQASLQNAEGDTEETVYAEIVHLPEEKLGNVICRPNLRAYEIPFLARSGAPSESQILAADLLVTVTESNSIVLYCPRLKKRVIPRLSCSHTFYNSKSTSVYRFLGLLQYEEGQATPHLDLGPLAKLPFTPRIRLGNTVVARAMWNVTSEEIVSLRGKGRFARYLQLQKMRNDRNLPRWVVFAEHDMHLSIDLDDPLSCDALIHVLARTSHARLHEMFPSPEDLWLSGPEGKFHHEIALPMHSSFSDTHVRVETSTAVNGEQGDATLHRVVGVGEGWLYVKIYGGIVSNDHLLRGSLGAFLQEALRNAACDGWFFVRYADPNDHLRVRIKGSRNQLMKVILPDLARYLDSLVTVSTIHGYSFECYRREVERYGGERTMKAVESLFIADTQATFKVLSNIYSEGEDDWRKYAALHGFVQLAEELDYGWEKLVVFTKSCRDKLAMRLNMNADNISVLAGEYRNNKVKFRNIVLKNAQSDFDRRIRDIYHEKGFSMRESVREILVEARGGRLTSSLDRVLASLVHMSVNRLFMTEQALEELKIYDILHRTYRSVVATQDKLSSMELDYQA